MSEARYPILAGPAEGEVEDRGSRFLGATRPVTTEAEAHAFVEEIRARHPDATHHCWAYVVGPPGSTRTVGFSDDGEPHNTAGRPILNVLLHSGIGDVAAVVTRYYGGTKLGRGGLVRAYGGAAQAALDGADLAEKIDWAEVEVAVDYALLGALERLYPELEAEVLDQDFGARVVQRVRVPRPKQAALEDAVRNASSGAADVRPLED